MICIETAQSQVSAFLWRKYNEKIEKITWEDCASWVWARTQNSLNSTNYNYTNYALHCTQRAYVSQTKASSFYDYFRLWEQTAQYKAGFASSRLIMEVKQAQVRWVLGWESLLIFLLLILFPFYLVFCYFILLCCILFHCLFFVLLASEDHQCLLHDPQI